MYKISLQPMDYSLFQNPDYNWNIDVILTQLYTTLATFSTKYLVMCKV